MSDDSEKTPKPRPLTEAEERAEFLRRVSELKGPDWERDRVSDPSDRPVTVPHPSGDGTFITLRFPIPVVAHPVPLQRVLDNEKPREGEMDTDYCDPDQDFEDGDEEESTFKP